MPDSPSQYDAAMECLALLPRSPLGASLKSLAEDLGLLHQSDVRELFDELYLKGIKIETWEEEGHRVAGVKYGDWAHAKQLAQKYVDARESMTA